MSKKNTAQPVNPFHPGEILLEEFLQPGEITQAAFARRIGWTKARLTEFVRGKAGVTAHAARDLGEAPTNLDYASCIQLLMYVKARNGTPGKRTIGGRSPRCPA